MTTFDQAWQEHKTTKMHPADVQDLKMHALISKRHARVRDLESFRERQMKQLFEAGWQAHERKAKAATELPAHLTICRAGK